MTPHVFGEWLLQPWTQALGLSLLHFLWQGSLVALCLALVLAALRRASPMVRYATACGALTVMVALPPITAGWLLGSGGVAPVVVAPPSAAAPGAAVSWQSLLLGLQSWMVPLWLGGVLALSLRLLGGWLQTQRLRVRLTRPARERWDTSARRLARRMRLTRPVQVLESALVDSPMTLGWIKPVVLLPPATMAGLSPRQLELVLAHELAHVRRHDYLVNLLQSAAETLLFYHPAVWWVSRRIRVEREHCADDLAVQVCGDPLSLARALTVLEEARAASRTTLAAAATDGSLLDRVTRLLGVPGPSRRSPAGWAVGAVALALVAAVGARIEPVEASEEDAEPLAFTETDDEGGETEIVYGVTLETPETPETPAVVVKTLRDPFVPAVPPAPEAPPIVIVEGALEVPTVRAVEEVLVISTADDAAAHDDRDDDDEDEEVHRLYYHYSVPDADWDEYAEQWEAYGEEWERFGEEMERMVEELELEQLDELERLERKHDKATGKRREKLEREMERVAEEWAEEHEERLERLGEEIEERVERQLEQQELQLHIVGEGDHLVQMVMPRGEYYYHQGGHHGHDAEALERRAEELERQAEELRRQAEELELAEEERCRELEDRAREREEQAREREQERREREEELREREEERREREQERRERERERRERDD